MRKLDIKLVLLYVISLSSKSFLIKIFILIVTIYAIMLSEISGLKRKYQSVLFTQRNETWKCVFNVIIVTELQFWFLKEISGELLFSSDSKLLVNLLRLDLPPVKHRAIIEVNGSLKDTVDSKISK